MNNKEIIYQAYVLIDPITNIPRYVGITTRTLGQRFSGHLNDVKNRPDLNKHKTNWFRKLMAQNEMPIIKQVAVFDNLNDLKQFEIDYIAKYKDKYKLINQTMGGDHPGFLIHSRESILKQKRTRAVTQYNVLGEKIADYEITEDIKRTFNLQDKACSHITQCCKGTRRQAYGYIWRYREEPLGDISDINPKSLYFNTLVQYDLQGNRIAEYDSYLKASQAIGDHSKGGNIASVVKGDQKSCKGYTFKLEPKFVYYDHDLFKKVYNNPMQHNINQSKANGKGVNQIKDGKIIATYTSFSEAAKSLGNYNWRYAIAECCKGKRKEWKGFEWKSAV